MDESLNLEAWDRLIRGQSLDGLPLGMIDGRIDLNGLELPDPSVVRRFQFQNIPISEVEPVAIIRNATWQGLDFSRSKLNGLRLFSSVISNCRFEHCQLKDLRSWATTFRQCSFRAANLRQSVLGGVLEGRWNVFSEVDFSDADLRETTYQVTTFENCIFRGTKLAKIDFQTSAFAGCVFEGELRDVLFYRHGFKGEIYPANEMVGVDFSRAKLHDVAFRGLTLDRVKLPEDVDHVVIRNVANTLDRLTSSLEARGDATAKKLSAFLNIDRKWNPPGLTQKVINIQDLAETVGTEGLILLRELLT